MTAYPEEVEEDRNSPAAISLWALLKDLSQMAEMLAAASRESETVGAPEASPGARPLPDPRAFFGQLLALRRDRIASDKEVVGEPAWDIMLALMIARIDKRDMQVSELAGQLHISEALARSRIRALFGARLIERYDDGGDHEDFRVSLSSEAARRMAELYRARAQR